MKTGSLCRFPKMVMSKPPGIVFAGYGIETPEEATGTDGKKIETYSSYAHLDVKDKWVLVFRYLPEGITQDRRNELNRYASLRYKALTARQKGARGLIVVSGPNSKVVQQLTPLSFDASLATSGIAAISVTDQIGDKLLASAGKKLKDLQTSWIRATSWAASSARAEVGREDRDQAGEEKRPQRAGGASLR
jgi:hypothetical protein